MSTTDYIPSYNDIRAILGVSAKELKDITIALPIYEMQLEDGIENFHPALEELYATLQAKKKAHEDDPVNPPLTRNEKKLIGRTQVYASYYLALLLFKSLPIFGVKRVTDGKAEMERMANAFENLKAELEAGLDVAGDNLNETLEDLGETVTPVADYLPFATAEIGIDPVTGE